MGSDDRESTAGIIIIGNEVLSGRVHDINAQYLAEELRELGVALLKISVIPDDVLTIGREAAVFSEDYTYVFTSGGIGPTHDDLTMEGIASGFGVAMVRHPLLEDRFRTRYGDAVNEYVLRMACVPAGAELLDFGNERFPLVVFRNIYVFPGIPRFLRERFSQIRERFRSSSFQLRRLFLGAEEAEVAGVLTGVAAAYPGVSIGSYPAVGQEQYRVMLTVESKKRESVDQVVGELLRLLPPGAILRVE